MAKAHYTIHVPSTHRQVGIATHHYLTQGPIKGIAAANLHFGHPNDALHVYGEETPELDSHMKQTGAFVGELTNAPYTDVMKQGKNIAHWQITNPNYQPPPVSDVSQLFGQQPDSMLPSSGHV